MFLNKCKNLNQTYTKFALTFPSPVLINTSTAYTSCTSNSAFSWSFLQKKQTKKKTDQELSPTAAPPTFNNNKKNWLNEHTFAGLLDFGWLFSPHQLHVVWADGTACLYTMQESTKSIHIVHRWQSQTMKLPNVHKHSPSIGEHLKDFAILFQASVTCVF